MYCQHILLLIHRADKARWTTVTYTRVYIKLLLSITYLNLHSPVFGILPAMPKIRSSHWIFHRHFSPLVCQSVFPPERSTTLPPLTQHKIFAHEDSNLPAAAPPGPREFRGPQVKVLIPKPHGEVSRINRGGYNLQDKLGWPAADYEEIRVCTRAHSTLLLLTHAIRHLSSGLLESILLQQNHGVDNPWTRLK